MFQSKRLHLPHSTESCDTLAATWRPHGSPSTQHPALHPNVVNQMQGLVRCTPCCLCTCGCCLLSSTKRDRWWHLIKRETVLRKAAQGGPPDSAVSNSSHALEHMPTQLTDDALPELCIVHICNGALALWLQPGCAPGVPATVNALALSAAERHSQTTNVDVEPSHPT